MAFSRPTLATLVSRIQSDLASKLTGADVLLRRSVERVLCVVFGGAVHLLHGHLLWLSKQLFAGTAETQYLDRLAGIYGVTRVAAANASGSATITGTNGTICPDGTEWQRSDGTLFIQDGDATISGGTATIDLIADVAGDDGNTDTASELDIVTPVAGIDATATVLADGLDGGTDEESDESLLERLLLRLRTPPKGGGPGDYVAWAREVAGVTRAWEFPLQDGPGTVGVAFVRDDDGSGSAIIPSAGEVTTVQDYIDTKRPVTAEVNVYAPTAITVNFTITLTPNTSDVQDAVEAEIADLFQQDSEPGETIYLSRIREAISVAAGEENHTLTVPAADITLAEDEIGIIGTFTYL